MSLVDILKELDLSYSGKDFEVLSFGTLKDANSSQIAFFNDEKLLEDLKNTQAGAVILKEEYVEFLPSTSSAIIDENPYLQMAKMSRYFAKKLFINSGEKSISAKATVDSSAVVGDGTVIEDGVYVMAGAVIGANVLIGADSKIYPNVVIYDDTIIGKNCFIQAGAIIGSDGYGYAHTKSGEHVKIYHSGAVVIEDDVEIGANSTIDRAVFGTTRIGKNTKIDNLVHIGHNCELGESCIVVAQSGLAGSASLGHHVVLGGQSGVGGHIHIGDFAQVAARGGVTKSIEGGKTYGGFPLMLQKDWLRIQLRLIKYFKNKKEKR